MLFKETDLEGISSMYACSKVVIRSCRINFEINYVLYFIYKFHVFRDVSILDGEIEK